MRPSASYFLPRSLAEEGTGHESGTGTAGRTAGGVYRKKQRHGPQRGRSGAANPPCTRTFRPGCGGWTPTCSSGCRQCWPGTRPSGICGAGRPPAGNTAKNKSGGASLYIGYIRVRRFCCYLLRNCSSAAFSSRLTCAWLMPISRATSICVSPLR